MLDGHFMDSASLLHHAPLLFIFTSLRHHALFIQLCQAAAEEGVVYIEES